ncbi:hypothetical protein SAMN05216219_2721 [Mycetocola miduiensis]|uniref:Uncharacterized protein n=1 Tax=Mycetocola miduiensis TaxID=995034 RepID=A0A1I5D5I6_9MICO|nr:hypothetical protein SAMN05216219_2721 [Mycetocola miduiensis]
MQRQSRLRRPTTSNSAVLLKPPVSERMPGVSSFSLDESMGFVAITQPVALVKEC